LVLDIHHSVTSIKKNRTFSPKTATKHRPRRRTPTSQRPLRAKWHVFSKFVRVDSYVTSSIPADTALLSHRPNVSRRHQCESRERAATRAGWSIAGIRKMMLQISAGAVCCVILISTVAAGTDEDDSRPTAKPSKSPEQAIQRFVDECLAISPGEGRYPVSFMIGAGSRGSR
jgi:hypothetical protein